MSEGVGTYLDVGSVGHPMVGSAPTEYSLWLTFEEEASARYQDKIAELAADHEDAPVFPPHVTVVGGVAGERDDLVETTRLLARQTGPITATFGAIRCSTTTHQCVVRLVEPSLALFELYKATREAVGLGPKPYNPHLSLVYSEMGFEERLALADAVDPGALPDEGRMVTLELVATGGPVSEWETISTVRVEDPEGVE